ncbi:hypothetical protein [Streptomyces melanogenes]|uniref:hypothetical protein n=1 Tax=Streptomyces melanogenes TaxID=67326 RepID=UPI0037B3FE48
MGERDQPSAALAARSTTRPGVTPMPVRIRVSSAAEELVSPWVKDADDSFSYASRGSAAVFSPAVPPPPPDE